MNTAQAVDKLAEEMEVICACYPAEGHITLSKQDGSDVLRLMADLSALPDVDTDLFYDGALRVLRESFEGVSVSLGNRR